MDEQGKTALTHKYQYRTPKPPTNYAGASPNKLKLDDLMLPLYSASSKTDAFFYSIIDIFFCRWN